MRDLDSHGHDHRLRIGSLFSGYGGLDLAVEHTFNARTVWYSEINQPVARVFAHHWPGVPNLGDISAVDWSRVPPVDILIGGFPCQDVSIMGRRAGLAPGTRSGLWAHMAAAIDALQPRWVVIENVRGLLTTAAVNPVAEGETDDQHQRSATLLDATSAATIRDLEPSPGHLADHTARPVRAMGAVLASLAQLGLDAAWCGLPATTIGAIHPRFRIFILAWPRPGNGGAGAGAVPHPAGLRRDPGQRTDLARQSQARHDHPVSSTDRDEPVRAERQTRRPPDPVRPHLGLPHPRHPADARLGDIRDLTQRWGRFAPAIARWEHITGRPAPAAGVLHHTGVPKPNPAMIEWLMGLEPGWVTNSAHGLTLPQQLTALGNGVMPAQAEAALRHLRTLASSPTV
jgi:DNA (cytosine-5)-methyltransferase 1